MANSVITTKLFDLPDVGNEFAQKTQTLRGTFVPSTGSYQHGGLPVSWALEPVKTLAPPFEVQVWSASGSGYVYFYNVANTTLQVFESGASGTPLGELLEGALPAAVLNDVIQFRAVLAKFDFFSV